MSEQQSTSFGMTTSASPPTSGSTQPTGDGTVDPVTLLVGEGKKFKTVQDLARGKVEADSFVEQLKTENATLRAALDKGESTDDIRAKIDLLLEKMKETRTTEPKVNQTNSESLTPEKVLDLLDRRERDKKLAENSNHFNATIAKALGDKANEVVITRLGELGMDLNTFNQMVATSPRSALKLIGIAEQQQGATSRESGTNSAALFAANDNGIKNNAYYQKLRRELKSDFYRPEVQKEMNENAIKLGDKFFE